MGRSKLRREGAPAIEQERIEAKDFDDERE